MAEILTYYLSRDEFRELAAAAVECRCKLVPAALAGEPIEAADGIDGFPERCDHYLFWMPLLGKLFWREVAGCLTANNMTNLDRVVHASFSCKQEASRTFTRAQMVLEVSPDHPAARLLVPLFRRLEKKLDQLAPLDETTGLRLSADCRAWMADGWTPEEH